VTRRPIRPDAAPAEPSNPSWQAFAAGLADPWFAAALFDELPDVDFFVKDASARYVAVSDGMVRRCGVGSRGAILGRTAFELFPGALGRNYHEQDLAVLGHGVEIRDRLERHEDPTTGRNGWWNLTRKIPLFGRDGRILGLAGACRALEPQRSPDDVYALVGRALEHLRRHFDEPLRIERLAALAGMSVGRFERAIQQIFRATPQQLLTRERQNAGARLLATTDRPIAEIAHACGYSDHSAFCRQFRALRGCTPSEYRAERRPAPTER
jgi:AraC-like DNA-binding protein